MKQLAAALCVTLVGLSHACASKQKSQENPTAQNSTNPVSSSDCSTNPSSILNQLKVKRSDTGTEESLCNIAKSSQGVSMVFLTNRTCTVCKPSLKVFNTYASQNSIPLYVAVPQGGGEMSTIAEAQEIKSNPAVLDAGVPAVGIPLLDVGGSIWTNSQVGSSTRTFPHVVIFNSKTAVGVSYNELVIQNSVTADVLRATIQSSISKVTSGN